jgi:lysophospholipase L1-like esterase
MSAPQGSPSAARSWGGRTVARLFLLFGAAGLGLAASEAAARVFLPGLAPARSERVSFWQYDPLLGWAHRPGQRGEFVHPAFRVDVSINSLGLRDLEYPLERGEMSRMLVIGDSFAWGFGVERHERISEILERRHTLWEIINAGTSGYGTDQQYLYLRDRGLALAPDVVLLLFHHSDFVNNGAAEQYGYHKPYFTLEAGALTLHNVPVPEAGVSQRLKRLVYGTTYLGQAFRQVTRAVSPSSRQSAQRREYDVTWRLIEATKALVEKQNSRLVLVSTRMRRVERDMLASTCERLALPCLQLDEAFIQAGGQTALDGDEHWNARGHEVAAAAVDEFLCELGVFTGAACPR